MDALDELNGKLEELCGIAERERERLLDELIERSDVAVEYGPMERDRAAIGQLALDYAEWTRIGKGFHAQLQHRDAPIARVK